MTQAPRSRPTFRWATTGLLVGVAAVALAWSAAEADVDAILRFAAEMALERNWREARFRWENAAEARPDDPKILNNLGVASEVSGDADGAAQHYAAALRASDGDPVIAENYRRFKLFWHHVADRDDEWPDPGVDIGSRIKGKTAAVTLELPVPARLELRGDESLLVTSFLVQETDLLDVNRELVRFLRGELRKHSGLEILDVNPPPAIPEQTPEDLLANREFWTHIGRNYSADLIVSGIFSYHREDASTFKDVDVISPSTGQKVRQSRFVEQEQFQYELDVFFIDGARGELRFRDRFRRSVIFGGSQNDPLEAFYSLSESIAGDVVSVVASGRRTEGRVIFKR